MAPTTMEKVGEVSGSWSRAERRRRQRQRQRRRHSPTNRAGVAQSEAMASSQQGERKIPLERGTSEPVEAAAATSPGAWHASSTEASSVVSSPMRWPSVPVITKRPGCQILERFNDSAMEDAYEDLKMKYRAKRERQLKLVTLDPHVPRSCMGNQNLLPVRDSSTKTILEGAKVVISLSSYVDGTLMARSSGFFINWDEESKVCTVLTSARLICSKYSSMDQWLGSDEYSPDATGPSMFERHYYMYTGFTTGQSGIGGPIINFNGQVLGMTNVLGMGFIPSSVILHCLDMWKKFGYIPRLHIGMKLSAMKFLDPIHVEKISRKCNIDSGLIVKEVSYGSNAEKRGVRAGDIIQSMNGKCIATTVELEIELMQICEDHLDKGRGIGSSVDIQVGIFRMCKGSTCTISLRLNISNDVEVFARGKYIFSARDCTWVFDDVGTDLQS
ncbi:uncharacterized protein LOC127767613 [Oryza glaberrima]|uniref:uncharacterized protein LOC127767613 n=1 Tax=Oryza glaberrima TaxID=4538 RepID=UPI00224BE980|nr:uncharacterized protein LOC127767613 [Oryza glaberrima]